MMKPLYNAFIRTHHITSRKKVQRLRHAAQVLQVDFVMLRFGGAPGLMYVESQSEEAVAEWVAAVHSLRYKDYRCLRKPSPVQAAEFGAQADANIAVERLGDGFHEIYSVAEFGKQIDLRGLRDWWQKAMGYKSE
ncbi:hypothetical protein CFIMG_007997RA00001 [Ceratocystis fimbriata CBS 114723]|uniref:Uncharacterized protein n=1 Tax=Ceratocystis fimbriata CBS 114723 TaxID=1035309 RepID=A0A2C5X506_9PEZI|nr:hypothetical protein CFIMG_007997RA00001 [Ceratocystis fimbriata CBS 114723]